MRALLLGIVFIIAILLGTNIAPALDKWLQDRYGIYAPNVRTIWQYLTGDTND